jgi:CheY-like chemotaxis protein
MAEKKTILVVDDEPTVRALIADVLSMGGYTCINAANGADALRIVEADVVHFDLVLSDVRMPGDVSGFQLANRVRELCPDTRVLLISGYVEPKIAETIAQEGLRVIPKPFRQHQLLDAVNAEFAEAGRAADDAAQEPKVIRLDPAKGRDKGA